MFDVTLGVHLFALFRGIQHCGHTHRLLGGLQLGATLRFDALEGRWAVWRSVEAAQSGLRPLGLLSDELTADMLDFCERSRQQLGGPQHASLLCARDGRPLAGAKLERFIARAAAPGSRRVTADGLVYGLLSTRAQAD